MAAKPKKEPLRPVEAAARTALEAAMGRALTDQEWAMAQHRIEEVAAILRDWTARRLQGGNV